jgi:hypothetical protein
MEWSIQDFGSIGEIVGGIGVIASLIYLGTQIRFSAKSTNAENVRALVTGWRELVATQDRRVGQWAAKWVEGDRSEIVHLQMKVGFRTTFDWFQSVWIARQSQLIDSTFAEELMQRWLGYTFAFSHGREIWRLLEDEYDAGFAAHLNAYIDQNPVTADENQELELIREYNRTTQGAPSM